jgi:hypothetical protein
MATEKTSHLSVVSFRSNAGWHGLLAFTGIDAVRAWDETARPVPVTAVEAAAAALADGRSVLVIDLAGPARTALSGAMLRALAAGRRAVPVHEDPDVVGAVVECTTRTQGVTGVKVLAADEGQPIDAMVVLRLSIDADIDTAVSDVSSALAEHPVLVDRCDQGFGLTLQR